MNFYGLSTGLAAALTGTAILGLIALQFLRPRTPGRVIPAIMLWQTGNARPKRRILREKLSQILSFLLPLLALLSAGAALLEPYWESANSPRTVIIAEPGQENVAQQLSRRYSPGRSCVLSATAGGVMLRDFGQPIQPLISGAAVAPQVLNIAALGQNLMGQTGQLYWIGAHVPAWLPQQAQLIAQSGSHRIKPAVTKVFVAGNNADFKALLLHLANLELVTTPEAADWCYQITLSPQASAEKLNLELEKFYQAWQHSNFSNGELENQSMELAPAPMGTTFHAWPLSGILFALALLFTIGDILLWSYRKTV